MKKIDLNLIKNEEDKKLFEQQMEKLLSLDHPHLLKYYKTFKDETQQSIFLIYEYMEYSDLNTLINAHIILKKKINEEMIWNFLFQCLSGLSYLHNENIKSLSIKPTNIYLNEETNIKISLFYKNATLKDKNYDIQEDIFFIGKYFYKMCCLIKQEEKNGEWIEDIKIKENNNPYNYSKELMNIIYMMTKLSKEKKNYQELYEIVKKEYLIKFKKISSINAVLKCLYSFSYFNESILSKSELIKSDIKKYYISYCFLKIIEAIAKKKILEEYYREFILALASNNSKIDYNKEIDPVFFFTFLLEKMHKELNINISKFNNNINSNAHYIPKSNNLAKGNIYSEISSCFYGVTKLKKICFQCKQGFQSLRNKFCVSFDLTENNNNSNKVINNLNNDSFDLENSFTQTKKENKYVCERCLTEQKFIEFEEYYKMPQHLVIYFNRGLNYSNDKKINFKIILNIIENQGFNEKKKVQFKLIGAINRVVNNGEEEFICFYKDLDNPKIWYSKNEIHQGCPLDKIQKTGQIIMLFYDKY